MTPSPTPLPSRSALRRRGKSQVLSGSKKSLRISLQNQSSVGEAAQPPNSTATSAQPPNSTATPAQPSHSPATPIDDSTETTPQRLSSNQETIRKLCASSGIGKHRASVLGDKWVPGIKEQVLPVDPSSSRPGTATDVPPVTGTTVHPNTGAHSGTSKRARLGDDIPATTVPPETGKSTVTTVPPETGKSTGADIPPETVTTVPPDTGAQPRTSKRARSSNDMPPNADSPSATFNDTLPETGARSGTLADNGLLIHYPNAPNRHILGMYYDKEDHMNVIVQRGESGLIRALTLGELSVQELRELIYFFTGSVNFVSDRMHS